MEEKEDKISFVNNATTREAFVYIFLYIGVIFRNSWRATDRAAHRWPWAFIVPTILVSVVISFIFISKARAERDSYNKQMEHVSQQLDSYKACYDNEKEAR